MSVARGAAGKRRIVTLRSSAIWQTELSMAGWAVVCAALASHVAESEPGGFGSLPLGIPPLLGVGILFVGGTSALLLLRRCLLRWDFRFVTDESTYFFFDDGEKAVFCPRRSIRDVRREADGIAVVVGEETVSVGSGRPLILVAVEGLLHRWAQGDPTLGPPSNPPRTSGPTP